MLMFFPAWWAASLLLKIGLNAPPKRKVIDSKHVTVSKKYHRFTSLCGEVEEKACENQGAQPWRRQPQLSRPSPPWKSLLLFFPSKQSWFSGKCLLWRHTTHLPGPKNQGLLYVPFFGLSETSCWGWGDKSDGIFHLWCSGGGHMPHFPVKFCSTSHHDYGKLTWL